MNKAIMCHTLLRDSEAGVLKGEPLLKTEPCTKAVEKATSWSTPLKLRPGTMIKAKPQREVS